MLGPNLRRIEFLFIEHAIVVFGKLCADACVECQNSGIRSHIALKGLSHERLDKGTLLAHAPGMAILAHRNLFTEFFGEVSREIQSALWTPFWVARLSRLKLTRLRGLTVSDLT